MDKITAIILTYNEEIHIERCIRSVQKVCSEVLVVDSFSTDRTCEIASAMGARVVQHKFENQAKQFNWAIDNLDIAGEWIWRVDADEIIEDKLAQLVVDYLTTENAENTEKEDGRWRMDDGRWKMDDGRWRMEDGRWKMDDGVDGGTPQASSGKQNAESEQVNGIYVNKKIVFMGRPLLHGGWYPAPQIKIIRKGFGRSEDKMMDEHLIVTSGTTISLDGDQTDWNLKPLDWWWEKHKGYAVREAEQTILTTENAERGSSPTLLHKEGGDSTGGSGEKPADDADGSTVLTRTLADEYLSTTKAAHESSRATRKHESQEVKGKLLGTDAEWKRYMKNLYGHCPRYVRAVVYFISRYILMGGFLDGYAGWYWHTRQGLMYRWMVDREIGKRKQQSCTKG